MIVRSLCEQDPLKHDITARTITRQGTTRNDAYTYNNRSELISDVVDGTGLNGWDYDNIGNRRMEHRSNGYEIYTANNLNQYTAIEDEAHDVFTPTYDADGNQTRVKTSTGIWNVTYNAKNHPVLFTKDDNSVSVECTYDYMGRRATKKVTENGTVTQPRSGVENDLIYNYNREDADKSVGYFKRNASGKLEIDLLTWRINVSVL